MVDYGDNGTDDDAMVILPALCSERCTNVVKRAHATVYHACYSGLKSTSSERHDALQTLLACLSLTSIEPGQPAREFS
jgi:hypothetical protein